MNAENVSLDSSQARHTPTHTVQTHLYSLLLIAINFHCYTDTQSTAHTPQLAKDAARVYTLSLPLYALSHSQSVCLSLSQASFPASLKRRMRSTRCTLSCLCFRLSLTTAFVLATSKPGQAALASSCESFRRVRSHRFAWHRFGFAPLAALSFLLLFC